MYNKIPPDKVLAWIKQNFPDYKERKRGQEIRICNPFTGDFHHKFNINIEQGICHCWTGDEWAGPIDPRTKKRNCTFIKFVRLYKKCSHNDALRDVLGDSGDIRKYIGHSEPYQQPERKDEAPIALPVGSVRLDTSTDEQAKYLILWLQNRRYTTEAISQNHLHHIGMEVVWPYYEFDELAYWQSRSRISKMFKFPPLATYDKNGKILSQSEFGKSDFLYNFDNIQIASYIIITESIFCQHTLGEQTLASGGAMLATSPDAVVIKKIKLLGPKKGVILSPDNDEAGIKSIISNYSILKSLGFRVYYSIPPKIAYDDKITKDWNELYQHLKIPLPEIRQIHDDSIRPINETEINKLTSTLYKSTYSF